MTVPLFSPTARSGMLVLAVAELFKQPPGEAREMALLAVADHVRQPGFEGLDLIQMYLSAKAVADESDLDVQATELDIGPVYAECQRLLREFYPTYREETAVQQMLRALRLMSGSASTVQSISAADVFGVTATAKTKEPA